MDTPVSVPATAAKVGIIIPTYNYGRYLDECLGSVLSQTYTDFTVLVIDNASEDDTESLARAWGARDARIRYLRNDTNLGLRASVNKAYDLVGGELVVVLSSDDHWQPDFLARTVAALDQHPECGFAYTAWRMYVDRPGAVNHGAEIRITIPHHASGVYDDSAVLLAHNWITNSICLFRRAICDATGGITPAQLHHVGDWFLWMNFLSLGPACYIHEVLGNYRKHGEAETERLIGDNRSGYDHLHFYDLIFQSDRWPMPIRLLAKANQMRWLTGDGLLDIARKFGGDKAMSVMRQWVAAHRDDFLVGAARTILEYVPAPAYLGEPEEAVALLREILARNPDHAGARALLSAHAAAIPEQMARRLLVYSGDDVAWACSRIRLSQPFRRLSPGFELIWAVKPKTSGEGHFSDFGLLEHASLVILQRYYVLEKHREYVEYLLGSGLPVVFEMDDLLFDLPPDNPLHGQAQGSRDFILSVIDRVDAVIVSTPALADALRAVARPKRVYVLANSIEFATLYREPAPRDGPVRIALTGTLTHRVDYALIESALERVLKRYGRRVQLVCMGITPERLRKYQSVTSLDFVPDYDLYARTLPKFEFDIALAPLEDNPFNRCKSNIKWLEYSAAGAAGIFSDLEPYAEVEHGVTGIKVPNTERAWYDALCELIDHPDRRLAIARAAQATVQARHTVEVRAAEYARVYGELLAAAPPRERIDTAAPPMPAAESPSANRPSPEQLYEVWQAGHALVSRDLEWITERLERLPGRPRFHIGVIVWTEMEWGLGDLIQALGRQFYQNWHLTIVAESPMPEVINEVDNIDWLEIGQASPLALLNQAFAETRADWVGMLESGDGLAMHALFAFADKIGRHPEWSVCFSDEDSLDAEGKRGNPYFKPDFNIDLCRSAPYSFGGLMLTRRALFAELGGYRPEMEGVEYWDLLMRAYERVGAGGIGHIADVLYHRHVEGGHCTRATEDVLAARKEALQAHLDRCGQAAVIGDGLLPGTFHVFYKHGARPLVSVIVPTKDRPDLIKRCVDSFLGKTEYSEYELLLVDNGTTEPEARAYLDRMAAHPKVRVLPYPHPFNFSAMNNMAAGEARGDYLLLLNNDTAVLHEQWLDEMVAHAQRPEVGIVGARLLYPNGLLQHAGVILGLGGKPADHLFIEQDSEAPGYFGRAQLVQDFSAVTAACLMIPRSLYAEVGGLDETLFRVSYNDVDLCLKVREKGLLVVWTPFATLLHEGSVSQTGNVEQRKREERLERFQAEARAMYDKWPSQIASDPHFNRNLCLHDRSGLIEIAPALTWDPEWRPRPRILAHPADRMGCGEYRIISPMRALIAAGRVQGWETGSYISVPEVLRMAPDAIVVQRQVTPEQLALFERYTRHSKAFRVFEIDDLITNVPIKNPRKSQFVANKELHKQFRKGVGMCDRLVVSTEYLAEEYRGYTGEVVAVPNFIERAVWGELTPSRRQGERLRVGWAGSVTHHGDLDVIIDVVKATLDEVDWVFFGMCPESLKPLIKEFHPPVKLDDYPAKLASLNLDLAVAPLEDVPFNHAKSHLRLLEYGVLGYPVICTDITPYKGAYPVTRVPNKFKNWVDAIREHVADPDALARRGDALREYIQSNWMLEDNLDAWLKAWLPN